MNIMGIDPGTTQSAFFHWNADQQQSIGMGIVPNDELLAKLREFCDAKRDDVFVVEGIASYGMAVGKSVFETCYLIGRILEISGANLVLRKDIKMHFCNSTRAKDTNIRQALIDRFGEPGTKKEPGMLYGVKKDIWSALAVAVYYADTQT